jgi:hypothetical protein
MEDEPRKQFYSLLRGFQEDFQPKGTLENLLVEKLASLAWRYRRMLTVERVEIRMGMRFNSLTAQQESQDREEAAVLFDPMKRFGPGLISRWENPLIRKRIVQLLETIHISVESRGFVSEFDYPLMKMIYGEGVLYPLGMEYVSCSRKETVVEGKKSEGPDLSPKVGKAKFLEILEKEIDHLKHFSNLSKDMSAGQRTLEEKCSGVPEAPRLDRMLRYEAALDRAFDRTLSQLERLQRIRKGQPVPPTLNVNVSA